MPMTLGWVSLINFCKMEKLISNLFPEQKRVVISNLNINSLPNKFNQLKELVLKHVDILVLTETKLDDSFSNSQFSVDGFSEPFRIDRNDLEVG